VALKQSILEMLAGALYLGHYHKLNEIADMRALIVDQINRYRNVKQLSVKKAVIGSGSNEEYEKLINFRGTMSVQ
jgi:hypothetical protein